MRTITRLDPTPDWHLDVEFTDGTTRTFDARPLLALEAFRELSDSSMFMSIRNHGSFVEWSKMVRPDRTTAALLWEGAWMPSPTPTRRGASRRNIDDGAASGSSRPVMPERAESR